MSHIPDGLTAVTPYLLLPDAGAALIFYEKVFGASVVERFDREDGRLMHAKVRFGDAVIEMGEHAESKAEPVPVGQYPTTAVHLYVADVDATYTRAQMAGANGTPPTDQFYGDREAAIHDPFGVVWLVATHTGDMKPPPEGMA